jgi:hypothetical protein
METVRESGNDNVEDVRSTRDRRNGPSESNHSPDRLTAKILCFVPTSDSAVVLPRARYERSDRIVIFVVPKL